MSIELDTKVIQAAVIEEVAERLISEDRLGNEVSKMLKTRVDRFFAEKAESVLDATISSAVEDGFNRAYQSVDAFGQAQGESTSIRERLEATTRQYWSQKVGRDGKPTKSDYNTVTRAEWVMIEACGKDFAANIKAEAVSVAGAMKDSLRAELKKWTDQTLNQLFNVKSLDDQKRK